MVACGVAEIPDLCESCDEKPPDYQCAHCRVWVCQGCPCLCVDVDDDDDDDDGQGDDDDDDDDDDGPDLAGIRWPA